MTGAEKIAAATRTVIEIKQNIQKKYDRVMDKIQRIKEDIDKISGDVRNHTEGWINEQKEILQSKIDKLKQTINNWIQEQLRKAQEWLDEIKKEITDFLMELAASMLLALT